MFDIRLQKNDEMRGWTDDQQYFYSLVWSSFLDLDRYTASRAFLRFRPYSSIWVVRELLFHREEVQSLKIGKRRSSRLEPYRLSPLAIDLALWTVAPTVFNPMKGADAVGRRADPGDNEEEVEKLREAFRAEFLERFGMQVAAAKLDLESRSLLPPLPCLGIEAPSTVVHAGRRFATARVEANVQRSFDAMCEVVDPQRWQECGHWQPSEKVENAGHTKSLEMWLRLPGGSQVRSDAKNRKLNLEFEIVGGPFDRRIDYGASEQDAAGKPRPSVPDLSKPEDLDATAEQEDVPRDAYDWKAVHIRTLRGFLKVEKLAGRPHWSRIVAERTVGFESPNHDRFRVETLLFWLAAEILAFVSNRER